MDFDGVIHQYVTPWIAPDVIPDPPVEGAIEWLNEMRRHFDVFVMTTRARPQPVEGRDGLFDGCYAIRTWLAFHGLPNADEILVTHEKLPALAYIDDRGWRFEGPGTFPTAEQIHRARPWNKS